jgi:hypothetical protein
MAKAPSPYLQMPLFEPKSEWRPPAMGDLIHFETMRKEQS